jgi:hypothetical protein
MEASRKNGDVDLTRRLKAGGMPREGKIEAETAGGVTKKPNLESVSPVSGISGAVRIVRLVRLRVRGAELRIRYEARQRL